MAGVKGSGGPPPKRDSQRRRAADPVAGPAEQVVSGCEVVVPEADPDWHPVALQWFESLKGSGQSVFYESSDWTTAYAVAEAMSREFNPQPIVVGRGEDARVEMHKLPPKGASLAAWLKSMTMLLVTEGDRRRARLELVHPEPDGGEDAEVDELAAYRRATRNAG